MTNQNSPYNLPNAITVVRILMVPVFVWLTLKFGIGQLSSWWGVLVFVFAISTDGVDGAIARRKGLITNLGKILDPIADKALTGAGFILLGFFGMLPWWAVVLVLLREWGITVWRLVIASQVVVPANFGGKLKTVLQSIAIPLMLSPLVGAFEWIYIFAMALTWLTVVITVVTGVQYLLAIYGGKRG